MANTTIYAKLYNLFPNIWNYTFSASAEQFKFGGKNTKHDS